ncbi:pyrroline-5-carboxylate reductase [Paucibacter sp. Y2R2-4]|uniref:pyrroline-5-carboxylate reductase n=1 Tax=Paucibacter sp. Y2R2-4 TaxID=2893553 RepID=UPI0021E4AD39|nr:pyrroline-5-carboxylate reductase [Paucibacter sp. Y2R2-4]MCV2350515.1 pyrroline-5-carboxylate reductase [Paucibacter sp. Y2R2-4]
MSHPVLAFIGGGNMASAIIGGLLESGHPRDRLIVVEPYAPQRDKLASDFGLQALASADASLAQADLLMWAVKPQMFAEAAAPLASFAPFVGQALHLSVMAGIRSEALLQACGAARIVRAMPNTPALIGRGMAGLYARPEVSAADKQLVERVLAPTGELMWLAQESDLDAVTALSGSGPAYFFYFIEAMEAAAVEMGLSAEQGRQLALATCAGAAALAQQSTESPATLRERVTSKGGTTYAALSSLQADGVGAAIQRAVKAAQQRARELGDEFGQA